MIDRSKVYFIDGYAFLFRAYYASPNLISPNGIPIGGINGFIQMLFKFIDTHQVKHIVVALDKDSSKSTERHKIYQNYKAHRPCPPQDLIVQFGIMREALDAFGIRYIEQSGVEADDIIASYAKAIIKSNYDLRIISSDKDLFQLINERVSMYDPVKDIEITDNIVMNLLGVSPAQVVDYLALVGDTADNIPGVRGIGPKTASSLLQKYHSLEQLYESIDDVQPERVQNLLKTHMDFAFISKKLASPITNIQLFYHFDEFTWDGLVANGDNTQRFFEKYSLRSLAEKYMNRVMGQRIFHTESNEQNVKECSIIGIKRIHYDGHHNQNDVSNAEWEAILQHLRHYGSICIHFDVTDDEQGKSEVQSICMLCGDVFIFLENFNFFPESSTIKQGMSYILESRCIHKITFDLKKSLHALSHNNINTANVDDIKLLAYSIGSGKYNHQYDLKNIMHEYLAANNYASRIENAQKQDKLLYMTKIYEKLYYSLLKKLHSQQQLTLYYTIDKPLTDVIFCMERAGVLVNAELLKSLQQEYNEKLSHIATQIFEDIGLEFNLNSPKQISHALFERVKLPILSRNKKNEDGHYRTDSDVLEELSMHGFTVADKILEWRQYNKISNTFISNLLASINPQTRCIHTSFNATLTNSGRLSSSAPNLQNIPIRTNDGKKIREAFIAQPSTKLISADYSQIEIRLLAHTANTPELRKILEEGADVHTITAHQVFRIPLGQVDETWRRRAKAINFGIIYGMSSYGLSKILQVPKEIATAYIKSYLMQYPGIEKYMTTMINEARQNGYVKTLLGRRCYIPNINSKTATIRKLGERIAINAPLQGSSADIMRKAMVKLPQELIKYLKLQIHDELLFEIPEHQIDDAIRVIRHVMESVTSLSVPTPVDIKVGDNWGKMQKIQS